MAKTTNISVSLTPAEIERLNALADAAEASRSWVLRRLLAPALAATTVELATAKFQQQVA